MRAGFRDATGRRDRDSWRDEMPIEVRWDETVPGLYYRAMTLLGVT
jgi:hypothetical protein